MYIAIAIASFVLNYGVQLSYYLWRIRKDPQAFAGQKTLLHYYTGWFGDGILVPLINILILYVIVNTGYKSTFYELVGAFLLALLFDFLAHFAQAKWSMTNWSMPRPFQWNFAGHWHMVSFPIQVSYLLIFFWIVVHNGERILVNQAVLAATAGVLALMALFLVLYHFDNRRGQTTSKILR